MSDNSSLLIKEWIVKGQNDLKSAEILYNEDGPTDAICFHCHQAVEKYLKAYLVARRFRFEKIHSLWTLTKLSAKGDEEFLNFEEEIKILDAYYIESRYPPEIKVYTRQECRKILKLTKELTQFILGKIECV
jgi:HEPN domain-containing protein